MLDATVRTALDKFFERFRQSFDSFDAEAIADLMHVPLTIIGAEGAHALVRRDDIVRNFENVNELHKSLDYHHAELAELDIFPTAAPNVVRAEASWIFRRADDSPIYRFGMIYVLGDYGEGWRVVVAVNVDGAHEV